MNSFRVLFVEDHEYFANTTMSNLKALKTGKVSVEFPSEWKFVHVTNQQDAEERAGSEEYQLVLLDLRYFRTPPPPPPATPPILEWLGMDWLPTLRKLQPNAAIVILTDYPGEGLENAVRAIRDHQANDFLPKDASPETLFSRIQLACEQARRARLLRSLQKDYQSLLRQKTIAARVFADDMNSLVSNTRSDLIRIADMLGSGDAASIRNSAEQIRAEAQQLKEEFKRLGENLHVGEEKTTNVPLSTLVSEAFDLLEGDLREAGITTTVEPPPGKEEISVTTYLSDLHVALIEVFRNSVEALTEGEKPSEERRISVDIAKQENGAGLRVIDTGRNYSPEELNTVLQPPKTTRREGESRGVGLHIAKRMMQRIGGDIEIQNRKEGGAETILMIRNLPKP